MKKTIMCVEDEFFLREDLAEELVIAGYDVITKENGSKALSALQSKTPDLIITDIGMPVMNGHELLAEVRSGRPEISSVPILILSAYDLTETVAACAVAPEAALRKPVDFNELLSTVEQLVN